MIDRLFNEKEAAEYLGITEARLKGLVDRKKLVVYKIGGEFLRFKQKDLDAVKTFITTSLDQPKKEYFLLGRLKDYFYYNDFYLIAAILIIILLALVFKASF